MYKKSFLLLLLITNSLIFYIISCSHNINVRTNNSLALTDISLIKEEYYDEKNIIFLVPGKILNKKLEIKNPCDYTLTIKKVKSSCACTKTELSSMVVKAGESTILDLSITPKYGNLNQEINISLLMSDERELLIHYYFQSKVIFEYVQGGRHFCPQSDDDSSWSATILARCRHDINATPKFSMNMPNINMFHTEIIESKTYQDENIVDNLYRFKLEGNSTKANNEDYLFVDCKVEIANISNHYSTVLRSDRVINVIDSPRILVVTPLSKKKFTITCNNNYHNLITSFDKLPISIEGPHQIDQNRYAFEINSFDFKTSVSGQLIILSKNIKDPFELQIPVLCVTSSKP